MADKRTPTGSVKPAASRLEAVAKKIKPARDLEDYKRILAFGRSGVGKTRFAASAPNVLMIDVNEKGTSSVRRDFNPNVFPVEYWEEINDVYWYLAAGDHPYESYAIDGITSMQVLCQKFVLGDEISRDASRDPDMMSRPMWGKVGELMRTQIINFRNLPMNGVFTALQRTRYVGDEEDAEDADSMLTPACSPSVAGTLEAAVGVIGWLTVREVVVKKKEGEKIKKKRVRRQRMYLGPSTKYLTKERYGVLPQHIDKPDLAAMIAMIEEAE